MSITAAILAVLIAFSAGLVVQAFRSHIARPRYFEE
jgi:hypothetical protein